MPSKSASQARLMAAAAHTPGGYGGVPQKVGKDFNKADAGTGILKKKHPNQSLIGHGQKRKKSQAEVMYPQGK